MAAQQIDWGDVPTWISAIATVAALIAAALAVRASWHVLSLERGREDRAEAAEKERHDNAERGEQADKVAVWIDLAEGPVIRNGSELPIYDVRVSVSTANRVPRGEAQEDVVPPGEQTVKLPAEGGGYVSLGLDDRRHGRAAVWFRDTAGREWERDEHGRLRKVGHYMTGQASGAVTWTGSATGEQPPTQ